MLKLFDGLRCPLLKLFGTLLAGDTGCEDDLRRKLDGAEMDSRKTVTGDGLLSGVLYASAPAPLLKSCPMRTQSVAGPEHDKSLR